MLTFVFVMHQVDNTIAAVSRNIVVWQANQSHPLFEVLLVRTRTILDLFLAFADDYIALV